MGLFRYPPHKRVSIIISVFESIGVVKLTHKEVLISAGPFLVSKPWKTICTEIERAIQSVVWPPGSNRFTINPDRGRGRGQGNGVVPIKQACMQSLGDFGWSIDERRNPYRFDAIKSLKDGTIFGLEWETGNISSSHRSMNRILLAHHRCTVIGGALILPTRNLYKYLTDRVGNYAELEPYFEFWRTIRWSNGILAVFAVEHDDTSSDVPRIQKGTNGRALV